MGASSAPITYPAIALAIPINASSAPLLERPLDVTVALNAPSPKSNAAPSASETKTLDRKPSSPDGSTGMTEPRSADTPTVAAERKRLCEPSRHACREDNPCVGAGGSDAEDDAERVHEPVLCAQHHVREPSAPDVWISVRMVTALLVRTQRSRNGGGAVRHMAWARWCRWRAVPRRSRGPLCRAHALREVAKHARPHR